MQEVKEALALCIYRNLNADGHSIEMFFFLLKDFQSLRFVLAIQFTCLCTPLLPFHIRYMCTVDARDRRSPFTTLDQYVYIFGVFTLKLNLGFYQ